MRRKTTEEFISEAKKIHGDKFDYSLVNYINEKTKVKIICPIHGVFEQSPHSHIGKRKYGCPLCRPERISKTQRKSSEQFIQESKEIHPEYDYSLVNYINAKTKVRLICPKHGMFEITPDKLLHGEGCHRCGLDSSKAKMITSFNQFVKEARLVHGDKYNYLESTYKGVSKKTEIICRKHGSFYQIAKEHLSGNNCPYCHISQGEEKITLWLNNHNYILGKDYFREYKFKKLGLKRFDFYIPSKNLLIEYNGAQHYQSMGYLGGYEKLKRQRHSDWIKRKFAKDKGIKLLTIKYTDFDKISDILSEVL